MPDLTFTLSGDNLVLTTVGGARLEQNADGSFTFVEGLKETIEYLPALTTPSAAYHRVNGMALLVAGYTGHAFRAIRNSDSAAINVDFDSDEIHTGNKIVPADIAALVGTGDVARMDQVYDQTGNGRHWTQTTASKRPAISQDVCINGAPAILVDGGPNFPNGGVDPQRGFIFTDALNGQGCTVFYVLDMNGSLSTQTPGGWDTAGGGRAIFQNDGGTVDGADSDIQHFSPAGNSFWPGKQFRSGPCVIGPRERNGPVELLYDGVSAGAIAVSDGVSPGETPTLETLTTGRFGYTTNPALQGYNPNMRGLAVVAVQGTLNDADVAAITRVLQSRFGIPPRFDYRLVRYGDSIGEGDGAKYTLGPVWHLRPALRGRPEIFNFSSAGRTLSTLYSRRALYTQYRADMPMVYMIQATSNDLSGGSTGAAAWTATKDYIQYLHGLGPNVKAVVGTVTRRTDFSSGPETQRVAYNTLALTDVDANPLRRPDAVCDFDAALIAVDASYQTNTAILVDGIHPTIYGYSVLMPVEAAKINSVLA